MIYLLERKQKLGSATEITKKLICIHFNNSGTLILAYAIKTE